MPSKSTEEQIEELVVIVGRGFEHLTNQVGRLEHRFDVLEQRFDAMEHRIDAMESRIDKRLDRIEFLVNGQDQRISILEDKMRQLATKLGYQFN